MCTLRDVVIFFAGAEFFHTLSHIILPYFVSMPLDIGVMVLTPSLNLWIIGINALITVALLGWAYKLKRKT
ncbi:hypothetical protein Lade_1312 [Legionella adelaidensis]|uniref:Uncharacterized protein n=1 Tax=Legionella adelaidensis TaxID=45056 RepID=A0A0W0R6J3_9GAMM|nr:hypothetical protein [Legionella adelaidensis]KTC66654.1 hypothetical protein Lade_1312 [Legionella adelaidensis]